MPEQTLSLFSSVLRDVADGPRVTSHMALTEALMRRMAEKGATLDDLTDPKVMKRSRATLEAHCKRFQIAFPDFTPSNMRTFVAFRRSGDFYEHNGEHVEAVAMALELAITKHDGREQIGIPVHAYPEAKKAMRQAGFEARVVKSKAPKP